MTVSKLPELHARLKIQINNLVDLSTVAAKQNSNRSWVKIHSALWGSIQSALTWEALNPEKDAKQAIKEFAAMTNEKAVGGWYGEHSKAHNNWKLKNLALLGMQILPEAGIAEGYAKSRAAVLFAGGSCPEWDGVMDGGQAGVPLPVQKEVREWLMDWYCQNLVQTLGRPRAADALEVVQVQLYGGIMPPELETELGKFGIFIDEVKQNTIHNFQRGRMKESQEDVIGWAIDELKKIGTVVGRDSVSSFLKAAGKKADNNEIQARINTLREAGSLPIRKSGRPPKATLVEGEIIRCKYISNIYSISSGLNGEENQEVKNADVAEEVEVVKEGLGVGEEVSDQPVQPAQVAVPTQTATSDKDSVLVEQPESEQPSEPLSASMSSNDSVAGVGVAERYSDYFKSPEYLTTVELQDVECADFDTEADGWQSFSFQRAA